MWYLLRLRNERAIAWGITAVALAVRLYLSTAFYLNPDEAIHVNAGSAGQWVIHHHPPLALWWVWLATLVSDREWWLRLLPTLSGALTPLAAGLWLRYFLSPMTAWGLAAFIAVSPNLVLLSLQLRGYPMAILGSVVALYALERAFAESSRRMLAWHFVALYVAILSEFGAVFLVVAVGLYGIAVLVRRPALRSLLPVWLAGQAGGVLLYALLYVYLVRVISMQFPATDMFTSYMRASFPVERNNWLLFFAAGTVKQFAYVGSSWVFGVAGTLLAMAGLAAWARRRDERVVLVAAVFLAVVGAIANFHPYGRSRHTALIGLVGLAAVGAGIELCGRWKWVVALVSAAALLMPVMDPHNLSNTQWDKRRWDGAMAQMELAMPEGTTLMTDRESLHMMKARLLPREKRRIKVRKAGDFRFKGRVVVEAETFDWGGMTAAQIVAMAPAGPVWIVDMGFNADSLKTRERELGLTAVVDEPGVLYLGRLR